VFNPWSIETTPGRLTQIAAQRPNYQDRQAASIKAGDIDITVQRLEKDYPS
jgi:hypothetical protein